MRGREGKGREIEREVRVSDIELGEREKSVIAIDLSEREGGMGEEEEGPIGRN